MTWDTLEELREQTELRTADPRELYKMIENYIDYDIRYAEDRMKLLEESWDEELYIDCVSSNRFKSQQVKKKSSASSEDSPMTQHLDKLADYILYSHFDSEEQEEEFNQTRELLKEKEAIYKKNRTLEDEQVIVQSKDKLRNKPLTMSRKVAETIRKEQNESLQQYFDTNSSTDVYKDEFPRVTYTKVDKELNQNTRAFSNTVSYWQHYAPIRHNKIPHFNGETEPYAISAYNSLKQMHESIHKLAPRIRELDFFEEMERERLEELREHDKSVPKHNELVLAELKSLRKLKRELQADYNLSAEILRKPVVLKSSFMSIDEVIPEDAWERLSYRREDTYHALILGYGDLKERYTSKVGTTMWCLLYDFEEMVKDIELTDEERVILDRLMLDGKTPLKVLQEEIHIELHKIVPLQTISNIVNKNIPKKFVELYDDILEDWIWIYRRKGEYKECRKCGVVKLTKHFSADKRNIDGFHSFCKQCRAK